MKNEVPVYRENTHVGSLKVDNYGTLSFEYDKKFLQSRAPLPISCSLPLREEEYYGNAAHTFFVGLLPEEQELRSIAKVIGTDPSNTFRILVELGKETIGGLSIGIPAVEEPDYKELSLEGLKEKLLSRDKIAPQAYLTDNMRLSIAGAQSKISLLKKGDQFYIPINGAVSNTIVKPQSTDYEFLVENEFLSMRLASLCGINTPEHYLIDAVGEKAYAVKRFDREETKGKLKRIMQEDFCQALGIMPSNKYEMDGGPSFVQSIELLKKVSQVPARDIPRLIDLFIFNMLIGNRDAHGKNFSIRNLLQVELAPAYDIVCTSIYSTLSPNMAMSINGIYVDEDVSIKDWEQMARAAHISWIQLHRRITYFIQEIPQQLKKLKVTTGVDLTFMEKYCKHVYERVIILSQRYSQ